MAKQVIVRVRKDGTVEAETVGMYGAECLDYFDALEDLLGAETASSAYTDDYHRVGQGADATDAASRTIRDEGA